MDLVTFKNTQGPIRERYAGDARAALLTLRAKGTADESAVTCKVETGRGLALAGIHPKCGGSGLELCSGDMLLEALIACAGVSMRAAAAVLGIAVRSVVVSAEGDVDLRGTLGVSADVPVRLQGNPAVVRGRRRCRRRRTRSARGAHRQILRRISDSSIEPEDQRVDQERKTLTRH